MTWEEVRGFFKKKPKETERKKKNQCVSQNNNQQLTNVWSVSAVSPSDRFLPHAHKYTLPDLMKDVAISFYIMIISN